MKSKIVLWFVVSIIAAAAATLLLVAAPAFAAEAASPLRASVDPSVLRWAYITAAGATAASSIAAAYAVARVASAAVGALTEKPELFGRVVVLVGLAEGIAIYGLIVSILILNSVG